MKVRINVRRAIRQFTDGLIKAVTNLPEEQKVATATTHQPIEHSPVTPVVAVPQDNPRSHEPDTKPVRIGHELRTAERKGNEVVFVYRTYDDAKDRDKIIPARRRQPPVEAFYIPATAVSRRVPPQPGHGEKRQARHDSGETHRHDDPWKRKGNLSPRYLPETFTDEVMNSEFAFTSEQAALQAEVESAQQDVREWLESLTD